MKISAIIRLSVSKDLGNQHMIDRHPINENRNNRQMQHFKLCIKLIKGKLQEI